ncbi:hypothetical protein K435DRAFT_808795 [Dendrothele bispora CBS 962.96]|uniref:Uncharacterized protein n=1 Tax=Dendrothele bispora (strain CBS 962.96) TaxID=1314807 RepID=A0A4S8L092_DENBC|nr:hypothetical protein K435DRAFT_808795 [Dendrothele bispora CBS 962.96]
MGNLTISESSLFSAKVALLGPIISLSLGLIVFGQYTNILRLHLIWTTCLFLISTSGGLIEACSQIRGAVIIYNALKTQNLDQFSSYTTHDKIQTLVVGFTNTCFIVANCIADSILIYRCYIVWGSKKLVVALPILASIATNSLGIVAVGMRAKGASDTAIEANFHLLLRGVDYNLKFLYINATVNFVLTLMIGRCATKAGRIWWVCRQTRALMDYSHYSHIIGRKYSAVIATLYAYEPNLLEARMWNSLPCFLDYSSNHSRKCRSITEEVVKSQNMTSTIQYGTQGRSYVDSIEQQTQISSDLEFQAENKKHPGLGA